MTFENVSRWLALVGLLLAPLGCHKDGASASPGDYRNFEQAEYSKSAGGESYYEAGLVATGDTIAPEREYAADSRNADEWSSSPAKPPEPSGVKQGGQSEPDDPNAANQPDHGRHIIYDASMQLAVYEFDETIEFAENIPDRYGGWVQSRYDYMITLRIPAARLREVMDELATLGVVLSKTLQASDVTAEYTDLESRITVLEQMREQLELLLVQAKTVEDSLKVRQELERVNIELEAAKTRMRQLAELIGFSTLTINLVQRGSGNDLPSSNDPFPWVDELGVENTEFQ